MKGWLLRQPARSRQVEDITPAHAWRRETRACEDVSYLKRPTDSPAVIVCGRSCMSPESEQETDDQHAHACENTEYGSNGDGDRRDGCP